MPPVTHGTLVRPQRNTLGSAGSGGHDGPRFGRVRDLAPATRRLVRRLLPRVPTRRTHAVSDQLARCASSVVSGQRRRHQRRRCRALLDVSDSTISTISRNSGSAAMASSSRARKRLASAAVSGITRPRPLHHPHCFRRPPGTRPEPRHTGHWTRSAITDVARNESPKPRRRRAQPSPPGRRMGPKPVLPRSSAPYEVGRPTLSALDTLGLDVED